MPWLRRREQVLDALRQGGLLLLFLTFAGCCGPDLEELVEQHRAPIEKKLVHFGSIQKQAAALPTLEQDKVTYVGPALALGFDRGGNASVGYAEDLAHPEEFGFVPYRMSSTSWLNECASIVRRGHKPFDPARPDALLTRPFAFSAESTFKQCEAMDVLLVLRTLEFVEPTSPVVAAASFQPDAAICDPSGEMAGKAAPATGGAEDRRTFLGGRIRGEMLLFSLASGEYLGGFRVEATSSPRIRDTHVQGDLQDNLKKAIAAGFRKHVPNATVGE
jgi:hypothetical protein